MMVKVGMVVPTWGKECGIADYTKQLIDHTQNESIQFFVYSDLDDYFIPTIQANMIDVVHLQYDYALYELDLLAPILKELHRLRIPVITTLHSWCHGLIRHNRLISEQSSIVIAHSQEVMRLCLEHGYHQDNVIVMPMGCRSFRLPQSEPVEAVCPNGGLCIGFFGFPFPHKGMLQLIEAIHMLQAECPGIRGCFLAHYPNSLDHTHPFYSFQQELQTHLDKHPYLTWIQEYLPESSIVQHLHAMDLNVLPYATLPYQGVSSAVRFLLAARRPIITTDNLFFSDLTEEVYKIPDNSAETIASAIRRVISDKTLQQQLVEKGGLFLKQNSWEQIGYRYRELYQQSFR
ncbi:hypothetical protein LOK74_08515 [Brevibacillus humidisoli]|uniref:hypothetical protein n=1 Tax=Brevibacillus humidisoli TaxID=2895522 RepID=UPI001E42B800|nr:hypothetical protein [Brevibacillus humidisoli]UFJ42518.1 hypothetical protein LOK74_08515 [Brevibacillus humidisoli]